MDLRELDKTNEHSINPVQIADVTCQNGSVESSLLNTIQEKQMIKRNKEMMILDSIMSESPKEEDDVVKSSSKIADVSAQSSVI